MGSGLYFYRRELRKRCVASLADFTIMRTTAIFALLARLQSVTRDTQGEVGCSLGQLWFTILMPAVSYEVTNYYFTLHLHLQLYLSAFMCVWWGIHLHEEH